MKLKTNTLAALAAISSLAAPALAGSIGVNFTAGTQTVAATAEPGIVGGANWNNISGGTGSAIALNDATASATTATLTYTSDGQWYAFGAPATPNAGTNKIYEGGLYGTPTSNPTFTVSSIPYAFYDIYVFGSQDTGNTNTLSVTDGTTTYYYKSAGAGNGGAASLLETTSTDSNAPTAGRAQYQVFRGLSSPSVTITQAGSVSGQISNNLFGFHIVEASSGQPALTDTSVDTITAAGANAKATLAGNDAVVTIFRATSDYGTNLGNWQTNGTATALGSQSVGPVSGPLSGLSADTSYVVRFHAVNTVPDPDLEAWSNPVSFSTALTGKSVADLAATPSSSYVINLTWTDNFDTETGYVIQRSPASAETWSTVANAAANAQSHTDVHTGLLPATSYDYRVLALKTTGESDPSNTATATTTTATPIGTDVLVNFDGSVSGSAYTLATGETDVTGTFKANGSPGVTSGLATINSGAGGGTDGFDFNPTSIGDLRTRNWVAEALITFESFAGPLVPTAISVQDVDFRVNITQTALEATYYNNIADVGQTTPLPTLGTRVHLALVWDASTGTLNGYVDGTPIGPVNGGAFEVPDPTNVSYGYFGRAGFDNRGIDGILDAVSFRSGTAAFNPATDFAILPGSSSFGGWITGFGIAPENLGFDADPDADGIPNGVEAFFGTNPNSPGTGIGSVTTTGTITTFTHPQADPQLDDVTATYEWSTDLVNWYDGDGADSPGGGLTVSVPAVTPVAGVSTVTATASQPVPRLFLRVHAEM